MILTDVCTFVCRAPDNETSMYRAVKYGTASIEVEYEDYDYAEGRFYSGKCKLWFDLSEIRVKGMAHCGDYLDLSVTVDYYETAFEGEMRIDLSTDFERCDALLHLATLFVPYDETYVFITNEAQPYVDFVGPWHILRRFVRNNTCDDVGMEFHATGVPLSVVRVLVEDPSFFVFKYLLVEDVHGATEDIAAVEQEAHKRSSGIKIILETQ